MPIPKDISKDELMKLVEAYDYYIQEANENDRYKEDWYPVCISEFYYNEFQEIKETVNFL